MYLSVRVSDEAEGTALWTCCNLPQIVVPDPACILNEVKHGFPSSGGAKRIITEAEDQTQNFSLPGEAQRLLVRTSIHRTLLAVYT